MEEKIQITKTVRYFTHGNPASAHNIWIVLHGYGQLPKYFIRKFHQLNPDKNFVVAPEGIHRFYRKGTSGRVGASWMTKEARLDDIQDNHHYLDQLTTHLLQNKNYKQRFLLGFSQGGATASRWHQNGSFHADHFILWGSMFPEDLLLDEKKSELFHSNNYFVFGDSDPFFEGQINHIELFLKRQNFSIQIKKFNGAHDIDAQTLLEIYQACDTE